MKLSPYLNFNGNAEEAFNFYKSVFGGDFTAVMKMSDAPDSDKMPEEEKDRIISEWQKGKKKTTKQDEEDSTDEEKLTGITLQRYKGLGEMNADQLWKTTMDPEHRVLLQVTVENAKEADHTFDILMGDEVSPRKKFIQTYAKSVKNLDI